MRNNGLLRENGVRQRPVELGKSLGMKQILLEGGGLMTSIIDYDVSARIDIARLLVGTY